MESASRQKWLLISFFSAISLFFIYFIVFVAFNKTDASYSARLESARVGTGSYQQSERIQLIIDQPLDVGTIQMTYRGRSSGDVLIDLVLLDLDPQYIYSRRVPIKAARNGFHISNRRFTVTAINDRRLRLAADELQPQ